MHRFIIGIFECLHTHRRQRSRATHGAKSRHSKSGSMAVLFQHESCVSSERRMWQCLQIICKQKDESALSISFTVHDPSKCALHLFDSHPQQKRRTASIVLHSEPFSGGNNVAGPGAICARQSPPPPPFADMSAGANFMGPSAGISMVDLQLPCNTQVRSVSHMSTFCFVINTTVLNNTFA